MGISILGFVAAVQLVARIDSFSFQSSYPFVARKSPTRTPFFAKSSALRATDSEFEFALLFDCDGVILETEELHRLAYNAAFEEFTLSINGEPVKWSVS